MGKEPNKRTRFQHRVPTLETLESRLLTTVENLEYQLQQLNEPPAAPEVSAVTRVVRTSFTTLSAPRLVRPITVNVSRITVDGSITLSALGTDVTGERNLSYRWSVDKSPDGGMISFLKNDQNSAKTTKLLVNKAGEYRVTVTITNKLGLSVSSTLRFQISPTVTSMKVLTEDDKVITSGSTVTLDSNVQRLKLKAYDQFGNEMGVPSQFRVLARPTAGIGFTQVTNRSEWTDIAYDRLGTYRVTISSGRLSSVFTVRVLSSVSKVEIVAPNEPLFVASTVQLNARAFDQFGREIQGTFLQQWSVDAGTITDQGLFTAPESNSVVQVTLRSGSLQASLTLNVAGAPVSNPMGTQDLQALFSQYFADGSIDRMEMINLLRLPGRDGVVDAKELGDLKHIVENGNLYNIPDYVQNLANDVVNGNVANQNFQGLPLGNLTVGSSAWQLNTLVDKWFLGADVPALTSTHFVYQYTAGNLFKGGPSYLDQKQGMLGDCYFISAVGSLAMVHPAAITDMFIDNGDGTFTVRFYGGKYGSFYNPDGSISDGFARNTQPQADYVTVDRRLPVYARTRLAYSGYGSDYRSPSNALWIALAEKAYAQWNETGNSGRNGANTYDSIQGGWMATVYAQVLGRNATNYWFSNTPQQTLVNSVRSGLSVTLGTKNGPMGGGLVAGHAYMVQGYDASTDRFILYNPWGTSHPAALTYSQLQQYCSVFVVASAIDANRSVQAQPRFNVRHELPLESLATVIPVQRVTLSQWQEHPANIRIPRSHSPLVALQEANQMDSLASCDTELQMLSQLSRDVNEIQEEIDVSLHGYDDDFTLALAVDEIFARGDVLLHH